MLSFLLSLLPDFLKVWLGMKSSAAENLGKAEQKTLNNDKVINILQEQAKAAANAPQTKTQIEQLLEKGKLSIALIAILQLMGCCPSVSNVYPCIAVKNWSVVDQQNMAADMDVLPADSPLVLAMIDYKRMRNQAMACSQ